MPSDPPVKVCWLRVGLWGVGGLALTLFVLLHISPRPAPPISTFQFVNGSAWVVTNLDLRFSLVLPDSGAKPAQYCVNFTRHFTNVAPGSSVFVHSNTPMLMLVDLEASHQPYEPPAASAAAFSGVTVASFYSSPVVVATPGQKAGIRFRSWNKFEDFHGR